MTPRRRLVQTFAEILFAIEIDGVMTKSGHFKAGEFFNDYLKDHPHVKKAWTEVNKDLIRMRKEYLEADANARKAQQKGAQK